MMKQTCPACQHQLTLGALYCSECGYQLPSALSSGEEVKTTVVATSPSDHRPHLLETESFEDKITRRLWGLPSLSPSSMLSCSWNPQDENFEELFLCYQKFLSEHPSLSSYFIYPLDPEGFLFCSGSFQHKFSPEQFRLDHWLASGEPDLATRALVWTYLCRMITALHQRQCQLLDLRPHTFFISAVNHQVQIDGLARVTYPDLPIRARRMTEVDPWTAQLMEEQTERFLSDAEHLSRLGWLGFYLLTGLSKFENPELSLEEVHQLQSVKELSAGWYPLIYKLCAQEEHTLNDLEDLLSGALREQFKLSPTTSSADQDPKILYYSGSHQGATRSYNQDTTLALSLQMREESEYEQVYLAVLSDGMGGEAAGEKAASLSIREATKEILGETLTLPQLRNTQILDESIEEKMARCLRQAVWKAHQSVRRYVEDHPETAGMGCTLTLCICYLDKVYFGHVGDSRLYHFVEQRHQLIQRTTDQTLVQNMVDKGLITSEEAHYHEHKNLLLQAIGSEDSPKAEIGEFDWSPGDKLLLCCDGVWESFAPGELEDFFEPTLEGQTFVDEVLEECLLRECNDNVSLVLMEWKTGKPPVLGK